MRIRPATPDDESILAEIHVAGWQAAYAGLIGQDYLDNLTAEKRRPMWRNILGGNEVHALVAEIDASTTAGFVTLKACEEDAHSAEVGAIYLRPEFHRKGIGTALWQSACAEAVHRGWHTVVAWVVEGNGQARAFYRAVGCTESGYRKVITVGGTDVVGIRVDWREPIDPDGHEFVLAVQDVDFAGWSARLRPAATDVRIVTLADAADDVSSPVVDALYQLALQVHVKPDWGVEEYLTRFDDWSRVFLAMHDSECVGYSYSRLDPDSEMGLRQGMTAVLPDWRRQGIGLALKLATIAYARDNGFVQIATSNSSSRVEMVHLNRKLGFVDRG